MKYTEVFMATGIDFQCYPSCL